MIHDKLDEGHWTSEVENWNRVFETGDVVIGPGHGSFKTMIMVHEINLDLIEYVTHRGVFWDEEEAREYAQDLHERAPLDQPNVPDRKRNV